MKLQIQYTEQDLREATRNSFARGGRKQNRALVLGLVGWIVFLVLAGLLWFVLQKTSYGSPSAPEGPVQDLVLLLLPNVLMAVFFLGVRIALIMVQLRLARSRAAFGDKGYSRIKNFGRSGGAILIALFIGGVYTAYVLPPIEWRAGRTAAMAVSFVPWIIAVMVLPFILRIYTNALIRMQWLKKPSLQRPKMMELSDEHIVVHDLHSVTTYRWSAFLRFREMENLFVLMTEDSTFLMVPKRNLPDNATMVEFRALLQTHIAEGYFLTVPQGAFPVVNAVSLPPPPLAAIEVEQTHGHPGTAAHATQTEKA